MHVEKKRIFVGNLPPSVDENEVKKQFSNYGNVVSVDIKQRKGNTDENVSPVFAFVNIEIDYKTLQRCFHEISDYNWQGYYVSLELAKESFLDRLKREREEAQATNAPNNFLDLSKSEQQFSAVAVPPPNNTNRRVYHSSSDSENDAIKAKQNGKITPAKEVPKRKESSSSDSEDSEDEKEKSKVAQLKPVKKKECISSSSDSDISDEDQKKAQKNKQPPVDAEENIEDEDGIKLVIKSNKHKIRENGGLKIESVNSTPIHVITKKGVKTEMKDQKSLEADMKRKQSLTNMKNSYNQQKNLIRNALSKIDTKQDTIVFHDDGSNKKRHSINDNNSSFKKQKLSLFDDEGDEDYGENINFEVKSQFEGKKGQKLLELQSKYTNDKRFALDERFAEDEEEETPMEGFADDEKEKQLEILESVLGRKIRKDFKEGNRNSNIPKGMLRFDPSKPEHSKFEIKRDEFKKKDKRKDKNEKEIVQEAPIPEVSKEKFYEVKGNLKESLKEKEGFSLLSMFGRAEEKDNEADYEPSEEIKKSNKSDHNKNPFKYDSSDTEDEDPQKQKNKQKQKKEEQVEPRPSFRWSESFFFEIDDTRLKDGLNFLKNINNVGNAGSFSQKQIALKKIIQHKVKNVERERKKSFRHMRKRIKVKNAKKS